MEKVTQKQLEQTIYLIEKMLPQFNPKIIILGEPTLERGFTEMRGDHRPFESYLYHFLIETTLGKAEVNWNNRHGWDVVVAAQNIAHRAYMKLISNTDYGNISQEEANVQQSVLDHIHTNTVLWKELLKNIG